MLVYHSSSLIKILKTGGVSRRSVVSGRESISVRTEIRFQVALVVSCLLILIGLSFIKCTCNG